jgi:hypothetical protein
VFSCRYFKPRSAISKQNCLQIDVWVATEIAQLIERLTSLEREFALQVEVRAVEKALYALLAVMGMTGTLVLAIVKLTQ